MGDVESMERLTDDCLCVCTCGAYEEEPEESTTWPQKLLKVGQIILIAGAATTLIALAAIGLVAVWMSYALS